MKSGSLYWLKQFTRTVEPEICTYHPINHHHDLTAPQNHTAGLVTEADTALLALSGSAPCGDMRGGSLTGKLIFIQYLVQGLYLYDGVHDVHREPPVHVATTQGAKGTHSSAGKIPFSTHTILPR